MAQNNPSQDTENLDDKVDDKATNDIADAKTVPKWELFSVVIDTLIKLTEHGYNKEPTEASRILLEKIISELDDLKSLFIVLEYCNKSLPEEYSEKIISHQPNFIAVLNSFMTTVYKCKSHAVMRDCLLEYILQLLRCNKFQSFNYKSLRLA